MYITNGCKLPVVNEATGWYKVRDIIRAAIDRTIARRERIKYLFSYISIDTLDIFKDN